MAKPRPTKAQQQPSAVQATAARLRLAWAIAAAGGRDGRIPPRLLRAFIRLDADRRALRATLRAVAASAPLEARAALRLESQSEPSLELFDALTAAVDLAATATERRSLEYARSSCARALWAMHGKPPSRS